LWKKRSCRPVARFRVEKRGKTKNGTTPLAGGIAETLSMWSSFGKTGRHVVNEDDWDIKSANVIQEEERGTSLFVRDLMNTVPHFHLWGCVVKEQRAEKKGNKKTGERLGWSVDSNRTWDMSKRERMKKITLGFDKESSYDLLRQEQG